MMITNGLVGLNLRHGLFIDVFGLGNHTFQRECLLLSEVVHQEG